MKAAGLKRASLWLHSCLQAGGNAKQSIQSWFQWKGFRGKGNAKIRRQASKDCRGVSKVSKWPLQPKVDHPTFPNNSKLCVIQRLLGLKGKFSRDELFHQEYTSFFIDVISKGYTEKVPQRQLGGEDEKLWYIPQHGVRHPKKATLRVVFDSSAEFMGTSLNGQLLQGPNLTSSQFGVLTRFWQESEVVETVRQSFYVDEWLKSLPSEKGAAMMVQMLTKICQTRGFTLTKWSINSQAVLQKIKK